MKDFPLFSEKLLETGFEFVGTVNDSEFSIVYIWESISIKIDTPFGLTDVSDDIGVFAVLSFMR